MEHLRPVLECSGVFDLLDSAILYRSEAPASLELTQASVVRNLCIIHGPCIVDFWTIAKSWPLPVKFLRGCGLPDEYIQYLPSLIDQPFDFYSCFICYSTANQDFAKRLHTDLQDRGVRCWFAPEDMKIGDEIEDALDRSIRLHDRLLLVLSEDSLDSAWVEEEASENTLGLPATS